MKIEKQALDTLVYQRLRDEILSGVLEPGFRLIQDEIAIRMGVSRIPVRDALRRLEGDGLIDKNSVGFAVSEIDERGLADLFGLRLRIDGFAAGLCARRVTPDLVDDLEKILEDCSRAVSAQDREGFSRFDVTFHETIYSGSNSPQVRKCVFLLWNGMPPIASVKYHPHRLAQAHEEHRQIFEAIKAGDHLQAEEAARVHVDRARSSVLSKAAGAYDLYRNDTGRTSTTTRE